MAMHQTTFVFQQEKWGWTESYHRESDGYLESQQAARRLLLKRKQLVPSPCQITHIRISDKATYRDSVLLPVSPKDGSSNLPNIVEAAPPWNCLLVSLFGTPVLKGRIYFRGIPRAFVSPGDTDADSFEPGANWLTAFEAFQTALQADDFGFFARIPVKQPKKPEVGPPPPPIPQNPATFQRINTLVYSRLSHRQIGRPFASPVGRR